MIPLSDLDILKANWMNTASLLTGAVIATITVVACAALSHYVNDPSANELAYNLAIAGGCIIASAIGFYMSYCLIGVIAQSTFFSMSVAFTASVAGALTGLTISVLSF